MKAVRRAEGTDPVVYRSVVNVRIALTMSSNSGWETENSPDNQLTGKA